MRRLGRKRLRQDCGPISDENAGSDAAQTRAHPQTQGGTNRWYLLLTELELKEIRAKIWRHDDTGSATRETGSEESGSGSNVVAQDNDAEKSSDTLQTTTLMEKLTSLEELMEQKLTSSLKSSEASQNQVEKLEARLQNVEASVSGVSEPHGRVQQRPLVPLAESVDVVSSERSERLERRLAEVEATLRRIETKLTS